MKNEILHNSPVPQNFCPRPRDPENYVMGDGNVAGKILMPGGHGWGAYLPVEETQFKNNVEPASCTAGGLLNALETIGRLKFGAAFQSDLSERYLAIMSGMKGNGAVPFLVAETMRTLCGAIPEVFLPFDKSITDLKKYFSPRPMSYALFVIGLHWNKKYEFKHEFVWKDGATLQEKQAAMKEALQYSPLGVSGYAWSLHKDNKYYKDGPDIHWFEVYDFKEGEYWLAYDTYFPYIKKLDWNYDFGEGEKYTLNRRLGSELLPVQPESARLAYISYLIKYFISALKPNI